MFTRTRRHPFGRPIAAGTARSLYVLVYLAYPVGCWLRLTAGSVAQDLAGLFAIGLALIAYAVLCGSSLQRQAQEEERHLDERELAERNRATFFAYSLFCGLVLLGVLYLQIGHDLVARGRASLWFPQDAEHWKAIFAGLFILSTTLPAVVLAWRSPRGTEPETDDPAG